MRKKIAKFPYFYKYVPGRNIIYCILLKNNLVDKNMCCNFAAQNNIKVLVMGTPVFSPYVCMEQIADALCVSVRTATRYVAPLKRSLGLSRNKSLTRQQVLDYFGDSLKRKL